MNSQIAITKLLQKLFEKTARQNIELDVFQSTFLQNLRATSSEQAANKLFEECLEQLNSYETPLEDTLSEGRLIVSQSQDQLKKLNHLTETSQKTLQDIESHPSPYSIIDFHNELTSVIKIYQRIVIELTNSGATSNVQHSEADEAGVELQQLLLSLDVGDAYVKQLDDIRKKIATLDDPLRLPEYCISIIAIIIDSTRDERRSSRHFLYTLNDSLTQFYINFSKNVKNAEESFEEQGLCLKQIQRNSVRLKSNAEQAIDISSLREHIFAYVENVDQLVSAKVKEKGEQVQQQLQGLVREIKELQNETKGYQKTIKKQKEQLHLDFLTKIPNRSAWSERLEIEYNRSKRYNNPLNLAIIDIDNFKKINDTFGHLAGDKVLTAIANQLKASLRTVDFLARYGGEEFAVLLPEVNPDQMKIALEKLCTKVRNIPFKFKKDKISITISIGCASFIQEDDINSAFERADTALYHAKNNGRNQVFYCAKE